MALHTQNKTVSPAAKGAAGADQQVQPGHTPGVGQLHYTPAQSEELKKIILAATDDMAQAVAIKPGETGDRVRMLRELINASGLIEGRIAISGDFRRGGRTEAALKECQIAMGLPPPSDGAAGPRTIAGLVARALENGRLSFSDPVVDSKWNDCCVLLKAFGRMENGELVNTVFKGENTKDADARIAAVQRILGIPEKSIRSGIPEEARPYHNAIQEISGDGICGRATLREILSRGLDSLPQMLPYPGPEKPR